MNGYNCGPGSNPFAGPHASRFVDLTPLAPSQSFADVDTTPPRMVEPLRIHLEAPVARVSEPIIPNLEPTYVHRRPEFGEPDRIYVPEGQLERLARKGLLRFGDDY